MPAAAIIPVLEYLDVPAAVKWLEEAFGFEVRLRIGAHRAQLQLEGGVIVVSESSSPDAAPGGGHSVIVRVEAIDAHLSRARRQGAKIVRDLENFPYGERQYTSPRRPPAPRRSGTPPRRWPERAPPRRCPAALKTGRAARWP